LAIARQTTLSEECVKVYLSALGGFDVRDVQAAVKQLAIEPRREFKPAFPGLGDLVVCIEDAASKRKAASLGKFQSCGNCYEGKVVTTIPGLDGRQERAFGDCQCLVAWRAARKAAEAVGV
jgi:hypothetical protein